MIRFKRWLHDQLGHHWQLRHWGTDQAKPTFTCSCEVFWVAKLGWKAPHNPAWRTPTARDTFQRYAA